MSSAAAAIKRIEAQLAKLKLQLEDKPSKKTTKKAATKPKPKKSSKPKSIDHCKNKEELTKFTVAELKDWIKSNGVETKKLYEKHKEDLVNLVWKKIKSGSVSGSSESSESGESDCYDTQCDSDSGSETDSE
jgi:hypothetical protein